MKIFLATLAVFFVLTLSASASHSWADYHWERSANPFTVTLVDRLTTDGWRSRLETVRADWSQSSVLDVEVGSSGRKVTVENGFYGETGWVGLASIWIDADHHILSGVAKANETYLSQSAYSTWHLFVLCQEVGHAFGLHHQDEDFSNKNLGTCMDYSKNPQGGKMNGSLSNEHPNAHDYEQLELIYAHLDPGGGTGKKCNGKGNPDCQSAPQIEEHGDGTTTVTWILPAKETS